MMPARLLFRSTLALLLLVATAAAAPAALASTFTVNANDDIDDGVCNAAHCSLREAIKATNASAGPDTIAFNLPVVSRLECTPRCTFQNVVDPIVVNNLPTITGPVTIDGTTQRIFRNSPVVEIRASGGSLGLVLRDSADGSVIRGLSVTGFSLGGIEVDANSSVIAGNYIGLEPSGLVRGNGVGVLVDGSSNRVGGTTAADRNVISGNTSDGIQVCTRGCSLHPPVALEGQQNSIIGNYIGTNPGGTAAVGNDNGISVLGGGFNPLGAFNPSAGSTNIGGVPDSVRNIISGNRKAGVRITEGATNTRVGGNYVGTNVTGTAALGNGTDGVNATNAPSTIIGRSSLFKDVVINGQPMTITIQVMAGNVISGNANDGVSVTTNLPGGVSFNSVFGNLIGTDVGGSRALPNGNNGVTMTGDPANNQHNVVGGGGNQDDNTIAFNTGAGVRLPLVNGGHAVASVRFNQIFANGGLGIDVDAPGVTPNDFLDQSGGPNFPVLNQVTSTSSTVTIQGSLRSKAGKSFTLDFYSSPTCDPSGNGEGQVFLSSKPLTLDADPSGTSQKSFSFDIFQPIAIGDVVTATTVDSLGFTSEFSACQAVASSGGTGTFAVTPHTTSVAVGQPLVANVAWTVPAPRVWRNLKSIDVRLVSTRGGDDGDAPKVNSNTNDDNERVVAFQIHWDEAANTFRLGERGQAFSPGSPNRLENEWASLDLAGALVQGSGPTGRSVTLTLPLTFKSRAAGRTFTIEVAASDDLGHQDGFLAGGDWLVQARARD
jgi:CSLREA domain-containing protein